MFLLTLFSREIARVTTSDCIFAHIRKASEESAVIATNCHPFKYKKFSFMHNGFVAEFNDVKKRIIHLIPDDVSITTTTNQTSHQAAN